MEKEWRRVVDGVVVDVAFVNVGNETMARATFLFHKLAVISAKVDDQTSVVPRPWASRTALMSIKTTTKIKTLISRKILGLVFHDKGEASRDTGTQQRQAAASRTSTGSSGWLPRHRTTPAAAKM